MSNVLPAELKSYVVVQVASVAELLATTTELGEILQSAVGYWIDESARRGVSTF